MIPWTKALAALACLLALAHGRTVGATTNPAECVDGAARHYGVDADIVRAVLRQEGGAADTVSRNDNGTVDLGPMQINSMHLPRLAAYGISRELLLSSPCLNVYVGTWMLKVEISRAKDVWTGIGNYHSRTRYHNAKYQWLIWKRLQQLRARQSQARVTSSQKPLSVPDRPLSR